MQLTKFISLILRQEPEVLWHGAGEKYAGSIVEQDLLPVCRFKIPMKDAGYGNSNSNTDPHTYRYADYHTDPHTDYSTDHYTDPYIDHHTEFKESGNGDENNTTQWIILIL